MDSEPSGAGGHDAGIATYAFDVGAIHCIAIHDGDTTYEATQYVVNAPLADVEVALKAHGVQPDNIPSPYSGLVVETAGRRLLIDTGAGDLTPEVGHLHANLRAAGIDRDFIETIVVTHGHPDHVNGNPRAVELTRAAVAGHPGLPTPPDTPLAEGRELAAGSLRLRVLHVPGHSADHIVLYEPTFRLVFTGDLLFVGKVGGTRGEDDARVEWESLQRLLAAVPDEATVWPGHDYGARPSSTIALEKQTNPFLLCSDVGAFLDLKANWATFKRQRGLL